MIRFSILAAILVAAPLSAQGTIDSLSHSPKDTAIVIDSLLVRFIPGLGEIDGGTSVARISRERMMWNDERDLIEALSHIPGVFIQDLGEAGSPTNLYINGADMRSGSLLMDGRPMNDPITGGLRLADVPLEYLEELQRLNGPEHLYSTSGGSAAFNVITRTYNTLRPITRIRFVQDPFETILTDLFFSQNILPGTNLAFGIQRQASLGRYTNAALDEWNLRTRIRWNASERVNISLSHMFIRTTHGVNGGVDVRSTVDPFVVTDAIEVDDRSYAIRERHDLTVSGIGRFLQDSLSVTRATVYYTTLDKEYTTPVSLAAPRTSTFLEGILMGARLEQRLSLKPADLSVALEQEWRGTENTRIMPFSSEYRTAASGILKISLTERFVPRISIRMERMTKIVRTSLSAGVSVKLLDELTLDADASRSYRFPTLQEVYWTDSLFIRRVTPGPELHQAFRLQARWSLDGLGSIALEAGRDQISDVLLYLPDTTAAGTPAIGLHRADVRTIENLTASADLSYEGFSLDGSASFLRYSDVDAYAQPVPGISLTGEFSYQATILDSALTGRIGVRSTFTDRFRGSMFDARTESFYENTVFQIGRTTSFDIFGVFHIGDAYITIAFLNILDANRLTVPVYPLPDRRFRIGVNWTFLD